MISKSPYGDKFEYTINVDNENRKIDDFVNNRKTVVVQGLGFVGSAMVVYLWKNGQPIRILIPRLFWLCWLILSILVWIRLPASRDLQTGFQRAMLSPVYNTLVILLGSIYCSSFESANIFLHKKYFFSIISNHRSFQ